MKRVKGFIKLRIALGTLHGALPDATSEELQAYDDECAICRVRSSPRISNLYILIQFLLNNGMCGWVLTGTNGEG